PLSSRPSQLPPTRPFLLPRTNAPDGLFLRGPIEEATGGVAAVEAGAGGTKGVHPVGMTFQDLLDRDAVRGDETDLAVARGRDQVALRPGQIEHRALMLPDDPHQPPDLRLPHAYRPVRRAA